MKFRGLLGLSVLALAVGVAGRADALPTNNPVMICDNCSNVTIQLRLQEEFGSHDTQYVLDLARGTIRWYKRQPDRTWIQIPVGSAELNYFNLLMEFKNKNGGALVYTDRQQASGTLSTLALQPRAANAPKVLATMASDLDSVSAWDMANSGAPRNTVIDQLNSGRDALFARISGNIAMSVGNVRTLFGVDNPTDVRLGVRDLQAQVEVTFKDGSRSVFTFDPYAKSFTYVPGSSRDSDNNTIPDTADEVTGGRNAIRQYNFSGTPNGANNAIRFNQRVTIWNVSTPAPTAPSVLVCTQVDSGPRVCRLQQ